MRYLYYLTLVALAMTSALRLSLSACGRNVPAARHTYYQEIKDPAVRNFVYKALTEAEHEYGKPQYPIGRIIVCLSEPLSKESKLERHFQETDLEDEKKGILVIYTSCAPDDPYFYGQLAHEVLHLLRPRLCDPYMEGLATLFSEEFFKKSGLSWQAWDNYFASGEEPFYGQSFRMMRELERKLGPMKLHTMLGRCGVNSSGNEYVDIDRWLTSLSEDERREAIYIINKHALAIKQCIPTDDGYVFLVPSVRKHQHNRVR
jgi:hypothetical protein